MPKTITDIIPPSRRKALRGETPVRMKEIEPEVEHDEDGEEEPPQYPRPLRSYKRGFPYRTALGALVVLALAAGALHALGGAKVTITPSENLVTASGEFTATDATGDLPFGIIEVEVLVESQVPAEGTTEADDPAQGTIVVYNAQEKPQPLIKNTRFESSDGLIFRIRDSITVPAGSVSAPGELSVTVYADAGGERYNIGPSSFTLPGLAGSPTFDQVYARSTGPMTGGFSGTRPSVGTATKTAKYEEMKPRLDTAVREAVMAKISAGYVLLSGATWTSYEPQPDGSSSAGSVTLRQLGRAKAMVFPNEAIAKALMYRALPNSYLGERVMIENPEGLTLTSLSGNPPAKNDSAFSFSLAGSTNISWIVEPDKVAGVIAGKTRDEARTILTTLPEVGEGNLVLRPFWANSFSDDPEDIEVLVETKKTTE